MELDLLTNLRATAAALGHWVPEGAHAHPHSDSDSKLSEQDGGGSSLSLSSVGSACSAITRSKDVFDGAGYYREGDGADARDSQDVLEVSWCRPASAASKHVVKFHVLTARVWPVWRRVCACMVTVGARSDGCPRLPAAGAVERLRGAH